MVAFALIVLALPSPARSQESEDTLLRAAAGTYRGRVLDAGTGRPIPDAVVVILWQRLDDEIAGLRRLVTALETFTNSDGEFVHDVRAVEAKLPPRTLAPRLLMFRPGYTPVPDRPQVRPPGVAATRFAAPAGTASDHVPAAKKATARSLAGMFMLISPLNDPTGTKGHPRGVRQ